MTTRDAARQYIRDGQKPVRIDRGTKRPTDLGWRQRHYTEAYVDRVFDADDNIGLMTGEPAGNLMDADLDAREAVIMADAFLPPTGLVHGRPGQPRSHHWSVTDVSSATKQFGDTGEPTPR